MTFKLWTHPKTVDSFDALVDFATKSLTEVAA